MMSTEDCLPRLQSAPKGELASRTIAMPADANPPDAKLGGDIFGGWIMALMDAAGLMTATREAHGRVATVAVTNIAFHEPVKIGDVVCCYTDVHIVGNSSMTMDVEVWVLRQSVNFTGEPPIRSSQKYFV